MFIIVKFLCGIFISWFLTIGYKLNRSYIFYNFLLRLMDCNNVLRNCNKINSYACIQLKIERWDNRAKNFYVFQIVFSFEIQVHRNLGQFCLKKKCFHSPKRLKLVLCLHIIIYLSPIPTCPFTSRFQSSGQKERRLIPSALTHTHASMRLKPISKLRGIQLW